MISLVSGQQQIYEISVVIKQKALCNESRSHDWIYHCSLSESTESLNCQCSVCICYLGRYNLVLTAKLILILNYFKTIVSSRVIYRLLWLCKYSSYYRNNNNTVTTHVLSVCNKHRINDH